MLPGPMGRRAGGLPDYIRRALRFPQMDLEYTFWQMVRALPTPHPPPLSIHTPAAERINLMPGDALQVYLCFDPKRVYKNTSYHKQTKNQWARDDPAFTVLCVCFLFVAAIAYTVAFQVLPLTSPPESPFLQSVIARAAALQAPLPPPPIPSLSPSLPPPPITTAHLPLLSAQTLDPRSSPTCRQLLCRSQTHSCSCGWSGGRFCSILRSWGS